MPAPTPLPNALAGRIFTVAEAEAHGVSRRVLQGRRIVRVYPGYYRFADSEVAFDVAVETALRVLPDDAALSHVTNLRWLGFEVRPAFPLHFATARPLRRFHDDLVLHRYQGALSSRFVRGVPLLGPDRTFVDCGTLLSFKELVRVGDWLVAQKYTDPLTLRAYTLTSHLDGVQRARRAAELVREGVESPRETDVRLALVESGLAEPELNTDIVDDDGRFLARGDMVYRRWKVLVEYDGWQHERDAWQRQRDHLRREKLEAAGWLLIVVTTADMQAPKSVATRVARALVSRGYPN